MSDLSTAPAPAFNIEREIRLANERHGKLRRMGFTDAEIAIRFEDGRKWDFQHHPGPGMRRVLLSWPEGDVTESSVSVDSSWKWSTATIIAFRVER